MSKVIISRVRRTSTSPQNITVELAEQIRQPSLIGLAWGGIHPNVSENRPTRAFFTLPEQRLHLFGIEGTVVPLRTKANDASDGWVTINKAAPLVKGLEVHLQVNESTTPDKNQASRGERAIKQIPGKDGNATRYFMKDGNPVYRSVNPGLYKSVEDVRHNLIADAELVTLIKPAAAPAEQQTTAAAAEAASTSPVYA